MVLLRMAYSSARDKLRGVQRYASEHGWEARVASADQYDHVIPLIESGWPEGVLLLSSYNGGWCFRGPSVIVNFGEIPRQQLPNAAMLSCETYASHRAIVNKLVVRGYRRFVWSVFPEGPDASPKDWPAVRRRLLEKALKSHHIALETAPTVDSLAPDPKDMESLRAFLGTLTPDTVVVAANDGWAGVVMQLSIEWGFAIPRDFSLVGIDNDHDACESLEPALTSVDPRFEEAGRRGAQLLDRILDRTSGAPKPGDVVAGPAAVLAERDTLRPVGPNPALAHDSNRVTEAIAFVRAHAKESITVETVADRMGLTRQRAGAVFRAETGHSIAEAIAAERVRLMQEAMLKTKQSMADICRGMPFSEESYARTFFRRQTGLSMGEWRKRARAARSSSSPNTVPIAHIQRGPSRH